MKILVALLGAIITTGAFSEDVTATATEDTSSDVVTAVVAERTTCADIQAKIKELSDITDADDDALAELDKLKSEFRNKCSRSAGARRSSGRIDIPVEEVVVDTESDNSADVVAENTVSEPVVDVVDAPAPELTPEQVEENLAAGLCADGTKPNKFGCCGDEVFKDMGNTVFACCPKSGGDCFPPIQ